MPHHAEDPETFAPSPGRIDAWSMPGGFGVRIDTHAERMRSALSEMVAGGISTNAAFHRGILDDPGLMLGGVDIHHLERWLAARAA